MNNRREECMEASYHRTCTDVARKVSVHRHYQHSPEHIHAPALPAARNVSPVSTENPHRHYQHSPEHIHAPAVPARAQRLAGFLQISPKPGWKPVMAQPAFTGAYPSTGNASRAQRLASRLHRESSCNRGRRML